MKAGPDARSDRASELMTRLAARTGLDPDGPQRRYLWTDTFAVCNMTLAWRVRWLAGRRLPCDLQLR